MHLSRGCIHRVDGVTVKPNFELIYREVHSSLPLHQTRPVGARRTSTLRPLPFRSKLYMHSIVACVLRVACCVLRVRVRVRVCSCVSVRASLSLSYAFFLFFQLKKAYCKRQGIQMDNVRFLFDGDALNDDDSPEKVRIAMHVYRRYCILMLLCKGNMHVNSVVKVLLDNTLVRW